MRSRRWLMVPVVAMLAGSLLPAPVMAGHCVSSQLVIYEDANYSGRNTHMCHGADKPNLQNFSAELNAGENWNDRIDSFRFTVYSGYGGTRGVALWWDAKDTPYNRIIAICDATCSKDLGFSGNDRASYIDFFVP